MSAFDRARALLKHGWVHFAHDKEAVYAVAAVRGDMIELLGMSGEFNQSLFREAPAPKTRRRQKEKRKS